MKFLLIAIALASATVAVAHDTGEVHSHPEQSFPFLVIAVVLLTFGVPLLLGLKSRGSDDERRS